MAENTLACYRDSRGEEKANLINDGSELRLTLRGYEFVGSMLDDFEPVDSSVLHLYDHFTFDSGSLCDFSLEFSLPISVFFRNSLTQTGLRIRFELGRLEKNKAVDTELVGLHLLVNAHELKTTGQHGWFSDALDELISLLPSGYSLQCCYTCQYSDYHPVGYGCFGCLDCFKNSKAEFLGATSKAALFELWSQSAGQVQEIHVCKEFKLKTKGILIEF